MEPSKGAADIRSEYSHHSSSDLAGCPGMSGQLSPDFRAITYIHIFRTAISNLLAYHISHERYPPLQGTKTKASTLKPFISVCYVLASNHSQSHRFPFSAPLSAAGPPPSQLRCSALLPVCLLLHTQVRAVRRAALPRARRTDSARGTEQSTV